MPRLIACLAWYDEHTHWLGEAVDSWAPIVSHVVAVDGAYAQWPDARARSAPAQAQTIRDAASRSGLGCTIHSPDLPWEGNQVQKRAKLFALAEERAQPGDWLLVLDADELLTRAPRDLFDRLSTTSHDVGAVTLWQPPLPHGQIKSWPGLRRLFRAGLGLTVINDHGFVWTAGGRRCLAGLEQEPAESFADLVIEHRNEPRATQREAAKRLYYQRRAETGIDIDVRRRGDFVPNA